MEPHGLQVNESPTIRVTTQGYPAINGATIRVRHDDIALVEIDMKTKHCQVQLIGEVDGVPFVAVSEWPDPDEYTHIAFPAFAGWTVEMADCTRYTVRVVLVSAHG